MSCRSKFTLSVSGGERIHIQVPDEILFFSFFFPLLNRTSLFTCAPRLLITLGSVLETAGQNHEGGVSGQGLAHQPQASFFTPRPGLGFVSKYLSEREHISWKLLVIGCLRTTIFLQELLSQRGPAGECHQAKSSFN